MRLLSKAEQGTLVGAIERAIDSWSDGDLTPLDIEMLVEAIGRAIGDYYSEANLIRMICKGKF